MGSAVNGAVSDTVNGGVWVCVSVCADTVNGGVWVCVSVCECVWVCVSVCADTVKKMRIAIFSVGMRCMYVEDHVFRGVQHVDMEYL